MDLGSFTGIRIGIASIKAIAEVKNIKVVAVTSLESLSYNKNPQLGIIVPMIDARNSEVYSAIFDKNHKKVVDNMACNIDEALNTIEEYVKINSIDTITFVGNGSIVNKEKIETRFKNLKIIYAGNYKQSPNSLGICTYNKFINNENIENADTLSPIYLRKSQAERMKNAGN